jgi:hypothetical protein
MTRPSDPVSPGRESAAILVPNDELTQENSVFGIWSIVTLMYLSYQHHRVAFDKL